MIVVYAGQTPPDEFRKSLFIAGPTPRDNNTQSWRAEALAILELLKYDGVVFIPENPGMTFNDWERSKGDYKVGVEWEEMALNMSDCIAFWIPRNMTDMPAFTTNDEWGTWKYSGKVVLGAPDKALKVKYQQYYADKLFIPVANTLAKTLENAVNFIGEGSNRWGGCRNIPLFIWKTEQLQSWVHSQLSQGNRIDHAEVLWHFGVGPLKNKPFAFTMHVDIYVNSEKRNKNNEFVFFRTDISSVVLYNKNDYWLKTEIVLVKEFRSPVRNDLGFVYELPGGSSFKPNQDPFVVAAEEVFEETGLKIEPSRFMTYGVSQMNATLSTHHGHLYAVQLDEKEMSLIREAEQEHKTFGAGDSEKTYVMIATVEDILYRLPVDWAMKGMILKVVV